MTLGSTQKVTPQYFSYSKKDGLDANEIYQIVADDDDVKWIGTDKGLYKFDNYEFSKINISNLSDPFIISVKKDNYGHIWVLNYGGQIGRVRNNRVELVTFPEGREVYLFDFYLDKIVLAFKHSEVFLENIPLETDDFSITLSNPILKNYGDRYISLKILDNYFFFLKESSFIKLNPLTKDFIRIKEGHVEDRHICFYNDTFYILTRKKELKIIDNNLNVLRTKILPRQYRRVFKTKSNLLAVDYFNQLDVLEGETLPSFMKEYQINDIYQPSKTSNQFWVATNNAKLFKVLHTSQQELEYHRYLGDTFSKFYFWKNKLLIINNGNLINEYSNGNVIKRYECEREIAYTSFYKDYILLSTDFELIILDHNLQEVSRLKGYYKNIIGFEDHIYLFFKNYLFIYNFKDLLSDSSKVIKIPLKNSFTRLFNFEGKIWLLGDENIYYVTDKFELAKHEFIEKNSAVTNHELLLNKQLQEAFSESQFAENHFISASEILNLKRNESYEVFNISNTLLIYDIHSDSIYFWNYNDNDDFFINDFIITNDTLLISNQKNTFSIHKELWLKSKYDVHPKIDKIVYENRTIPLGSKLNIRGNEDFIEIHLKSQHHKKNVGFYYKFGNDSIQYSNDNMIVIEDMKDGSHTFNLSYSPFYFNLKNSQELRIDFDRTQDLRVTPFLALGIISILILFYFFNRNLTKKKHSHTILRLESQIEDLYLRDKKFSLNPHLIGNYLQFVSKELIYGDRKKAKIILESFTSFLKILYEYSNHSTINLSKEIQFIESYVNIESLRNVNKIDLKVDTRSISENNLIEIEIPVMIIQPIIENSIKHNRNLDNRVLKIHIEITYENCLIVQIVDNGIGLKENNVIRKSSLKIVEESINIFNRREGGLIIKNRIGTNGTETIIKLYVS